jgi:RHS repeat-associated protein
MQYYPFGSVRSGGVATDRTYTGQQTEAGSALKLSYYHARFYSAELGHFVSADPVGGSVSDPQSWNPYAYVRNNPLRYTDPTGKLPSDREDEALANLKVQNWLEWIAGEWAAKNAQAAGTPGPESSSTPIAMELPCGEAGPCEARPSVAVLPALLFGCYVGCDVTGGYSPISVSPLDVTLIALPMAGGGERSIKLILEEDLAAAQVRFAARGLTKAQELAVEKSPKLYPMFRGERIDTFAKEIVLRDTRLKTLKVTARFKGGPDFVDVARGVWYDVTTAGQWAAHELRYAPWGEGIPLIYP